VTNRVDTSHLVRVDDMSGEDEQEAELLKEHLGEAHKYLHTFTWCRAIKDEFFGCGVGGVVAVFLFRIDPDEGADEWLWVIVGDLPSAYLVTDEASDACKALSVYCRLMDDWIYAVRTGAALDDVYPVAADPTPENAAMLAARIRLLRDEILPAFQSQSCRPRSS